MARPEIVYEALAKLAPWQSLATKEDIRRLEERMVTKDDLKNYATKDDFKRLENMITALGARWGTLSEDAFREGVREILEKVGWKATRELLYDKDGYVFGEPSDVEYDIVMRDGKVILLELISSLKRGDLPVLKKKRELYEKSKGVKVDLIYVITPFVHDRYPERVKVMAKEMEIEVVYPSP